MSGFFNYSKLSILVFACSVSYSTFSLASNNTTTTQNSNSNPTVSSGSGLFLQGNSNKTANTTSTTTASVPNDDPLKPYNKVVFSINRGLNDYLITPIAKGYNFVLPNPVKKGISNFFANINSVNTIANEILQFRLYDAWSDIWRLAINSSVGIGGLFDVASHMGLERHRQEFGLTLAYWGWENSSYFIIPVIGPSTIRDTVGLGGDYFMSVYPYIHSTALSDGLLALFFVSYRAEIVDLQEIEEQAALDRYAFEKNAYLQHRNYRIQANKGQTEVDNYVPDSDDEETTTKHKKVEEKAKKEMKQQPSQQKQTS